MGEAPRPGLVFGIIRHHTSKRLPRTELKVFTAAKDAAITL